MQLCINTSIENDGITMASGRYFLFQQVICLICNKFPIINLDNISINVHGSVVDIGPALISRLPYRNTWIIMDRIYHVNCLLQGKRLPVATKETGTSRIIMQPWKQGQNHHTHALILFLSLFFTLKCITYRKEHKRSFVQLHTYSFHSLQHTEAWHLSIASVLLILCNTF